MLKYEQYKNMTTKMKRQESTELPRFAVGALAIAGASAANGATVQITFTNNVVSSVTGAVNFVADLTGDSVDDVTQDHALGRAATVYPAGASTSIVYAFYRKPAVGAPTRQIWLADRSNATITSINGPALSRRGLVPLQFTDGRIGVGTRSGWLDVTATASSTLYEVRIHRLIFDDASTTAPTGLTSASTGIPEWSAVPEPSSLGLLALGAGGLIARRRRQAA